MLLGNKCDMEDKRVVPKAKGEQVREEHSITIIIILSLLFLFLFEPSTPERWLFSSRLRGKKKCLCQ